MSIAFCFLVYDSIEHNKIWESFFAGDHTETANIYSHIKEVSGKTTEWLLKGKVRTVKTDWCSEGLIYAFNSMLRKALKNNDNKYFAILSGSCIPLYTYQEVYKRIFSESRARMIIERGIDHVFEGVKNVYNSHQWVILNREIAQDYVRLGDKHDKKATDFLKQLRSVYKEHGVVVGNFKATKHEDSTWLGGCPDEIYPINWLYHLYGKDLRKHVKNQMTTYTYWDFSISNDHPTVFDTDSVKKFRATICSSGAVFARKFTPDAAEFIAMRCGKPTKNIVCKELVGRLGNQMFQYASILGIATRNGGKECVLKETLYDPDRHKKDDIQNVFKGPFTKCKNVENAIVVPEKGYALYDALRFESKGTIEIETDLDQGFLQSWKYFDNVSDVVRKKFTFRSSILQSARKHLKKNGKVVGIHIRRGDHVDHHYLRFPTLSYFVRARERMKSLFGQNTEFIAVGNDKEWMEKHLKWVRIIDTGSVSKDMAVLSLCDGIITSIGTFGWWGGYLCGGPVIYYGKEFVVTHPINKGRVKKEDYYPKQWIEMV